MVLKLFCYNFLQFTIYNPVINIVGVKYFCSWFGLVKVHVLPREMLGKSTFGLSMWLLKWLPMRLVDRFLLMVSWLLLGDTSHLGLDRPRLGPLELKNLSGKTPVLDVGTLAKIKGGDIKVLIPPCLVIKSISSFFFNLNKDIIFHLINKS